MKRLPPTYFSIPIYTVHPDKWISACCHSPGFFWCKHKILLRINQVLVFVNQQCHIWWNKHILIVKTFSNNKIISVGKQPVSLSCLDTPSCAILSPAADLLLSDCPPSMTQITKLLSPSWLTFEAEDLSYTQRLISEPQKDRLFQTTTEMSLLLAQTTAHTLCLITHGILFVADLNRGVAAGLFNNPSKHCKHLNILMKWTFPLNLLVSITDYFKTQNN